MKNKNLSWAAALFVFALLLWCTAATPGKIADPSTYTCAVYSTFFSLLPPVIAIVLALNTKEVYTSLLVGIASGALLYANGNLELALNTLFFNEEGGMIAKLSDSSNVGILVFLVMLGILVALMNKAGGSAAFGRWASKHIHSRAGAQFATLLLGVMIFVDDYFNCLTVGSVMRPVTDRQKVSRAKLAYLIDATAAPICIIAPVSSWAAAVTSSVPEGAGINGFTMFLRTIPYNYYALLTVVMSLFLIFTGTDFGSMKLNEDNAKNGDLFTTEDRPYGDDVDDGTETKGHVVDLIAPVLVLIAACIFGMIYTGGFFDGVDFVTAFADCNASAGLVMGSSIALLFTFVFYRVRSVMTFQDFAACIPEGFKAMVSPMLILTLAWTLSGMTGLLGAKYYVANLLGGSAAALQYLLPVIIFLVAVFLAFATGTSWGTFSILIPIVCHAFPEGEMLVISIAACLSGAVCGDHCSPIDLRQAGIRLDTHIIGQRQADKQGLDQSLYHNPQRLVMSIEISDHAKQHRCYDGLQCEAPQIIISFLNNDSISCKDSCQKISFKHYKDKYDTSDHEANTNSGIHCFLRPLLISGSHILRNKGCHRLHQGAWYQHGKIYNLTGYTITR